MCPPVIAALPAIGTWIAGNAVTILSVAASATSVYAQGQSAKAQSAQIQAQADNEREEVGAAAEEDLGQRIRASREKRARARVSAGESGALGASFAASLNQSLSDDNADAALIQKNAGFASRGVTDRANTALSQIRSPSALEAGLQIAGAGLAGREKDLSIAERKNPVPKKDEDS